MNEEANEFYAKWVLKAESNDDESLTGVFDKFVSLFIAYNFLYNEIPIRLIERGIHVPSSLNDNKSATELPIKLLGGERMMNNWSDCLNEIDIIRNLIDQEAFYINLKYGQRQRNEDLKILSFLNSEKADQRAKGVLQVIYYVRCNLMHGNKGFEPYQRVLLEPLIKLLKKVMDLLKEELSRDNN